MVYSTFWKRFLGSVIDSIIIMSAVFVVNRTIPVIGWMISLTFGFFYFPFFWSSTAQATPGKYIVGTVVTDHLGGRITLKMALIRYFASWISSVLLFLGYLLVFFTEKNQTLHDLMAGTFVIDKEENVVPEGLFQSWLDQIKSLKK